MRSVDLVGIQMEVSSGAPVVILREHDAPHRFLPIFVGGPEAASIAVAATGVTPPRPLTHDLTATLVTTLGGHLDAVEVSGLDDGTYLATMTLSAASGELRVDTRPSDAIALAVRLGAPLFVSEAVLDAAGALPSDDTDTDTNTHDADADAAPAEPLDAALIEAEVDQFRDLLGSLDSAAIWSSLTDGDDAATDDATATTDEADPDDAHTDDADGDVDTD